MKMFRQLALRMATVAIAWAVIGLTTSRASNCDVRPPAYKTTTVYQTMQVSHTTSAIKYTVCGKAYRVKVVSYRYITLPGEKRGHAKW